MNQKPVQDILKPTVAATLLLLPSVPWAPSWNNFYFLYTLWLSRQIPLLSPWFCRVQTSAPSSHSTYSSWLQLSFLSVIHWPLPEHCFYRNFLPSATPVIKHAADVCWALFSNSVKITIIVCLAYCHSLPASSPASPNPFSPGYSHLSSSQISSYPLNLRPFKIKSKFLNMTYKSIMPLTLYTAFLLLGRITQVSL